MAEKKILVVDDDETTLELFAHRLACLGFDYDKAGTGEAAVRKMREKKIHLVLTDLKMPEMDGLQLMKHIKEKYPDVPVVVMTGFRDEYSREEAFAAGAAAFLEKPVPMAALKECLHQILGTPSAVV